MVVQSASPYGIYSAVLYWLASSSCLCPFCASRLLTLPPPFTQGISSPTQLQFPMLDDITKHEDLSSDPQNPPEAGYSCVSSAPRERTGRRILRSSWASLSFEIGLCCEHQARCLCCPCQCRNAGIAGACCGTHSYVGSGDLNSGPHACVSNKDIFLVFKIHNFCPSHCQVPSHE